jgi:membrane-bound lytic murein transglycosylase MltF
MNKDEAHKRLAEIGRLEKEERKRQEVWALSNDPVYSHLIVSYNEGYKALRFVTAVAKEGGQRVRYEDVMEVKNAQRSQAEQSVTYTLAVPAQVSDNRPAYVIKAIGDPEYVKYYSVEVSE